MTPILTYNAGKFLLKDASEPLRKKLNKDAFWKAGALDSYETQSLKAAVAFRQLADERVKKILNQTSQVHYEVPSLPPELLGRLDPHQRAGLEWVLRRKRSYLAHAPGAGKTAQAILAAHLATGSGPSLFIVPPSLLKNWENEIWKVTGWVNAWPTIGIVPLTERKEQMAWRADFIVCPDSMLTKEWVYERLLTLDPKFIAVDEASRFKESLSERSLAFYGGLIKTKTKIRSYTGLFQRARHVVFMDGSPVMNRPMELWAPTYALCPEAIDYRDQDDFGYRYCGPTINPYGQWEFRHSSNEAELGEKLQKDFMHVVKEEELSHPERRRSMFFLNEDVRSPEQKRWEQTDLPNFRLDDLDDGTDRGKLAHFRRELGMRKVPLVAGYVLDRLRNTNESILLFAWHREVCEELSDRLGNFRPGLVMGGTHPNEREGYFTQFQKGIRRIIIGNVEAMGRGHNLQRADRVIFAEWSWSDEVNKQAEKRASRRGSEKEFVRCDYLVCPDSMDVPILKSVFTKEKRVRRILG